MIFLTKVEMFCAGTHLADYCCSLRVTSSLGNGYPARDAAYSNAYEQNSMGHGESHQLYVDPLSKHVVHAADVLDCSYELCYERHFPDSVVLP